MAGPRRRARELALQVLFQREFSQDRDLSEALKYFGQNSPEAKSYAETLLKLLDLHKDDVDHKIQSVSENWKIDRMALVDLSVLRIGTVELIYLAEEVPSTVVINEAVEIAKTFGTSDSAAFINGVLDKLAKGQ